MEASALRLLEACYNDDSGERVWVEVPPPPSRKRPAALMAAAAAVLAAGICCGRPTLQRSRPAYVSVSVAPGDTIWELARKHGPRNAYPLSVAQEIRRANHLPNSVLQPGQVIRIPTSLPAMHLQWRTSAALARERAK